MAKSLQNFTFPKKNEKFELLYRFFFHVTFSFSGGEIKIIMLFSVMPSEKISPVAPFFFFKKKKSALASHNSVAGSPVFLPLNTSRRGGTLPNVQFSSP